MSNLTPVPASQRPLLGWREWLSLPGLNVAAIKAKVDSGARSSALHAFDITISPVENGSVVRFKVHPLQRRSEPVIECHAPLLELRTVRNSGGIETVRPVILTDLTLGGQTWPIELTLTGRDSMGFRMLLGRQAIRGRFLLNPGRSYLMGKPPLELRGGGRKKNKGNLP